MPPLMQWSRSPSPLLGPQPPLSHPLTPPANHLSHRQHNPQPIPHAFRLRHTSQQPIRYPPHRPKPYDAHLLQGHSQPQPPLTHALHAASRPGTPHGRRLQTSYLPHTLPTALTVQPTPQHLYSLLPHNQETAHQHNHAVAYVPPNPRHRRPDTDLAHCSDPHMHPSTRHHTRTPHHKRRPSHATHAF